MTVVVRRLLLLGALATLHMFLAAEGSAQPQVAQMSGVPLPTGDLPAGSVSVRIVRESLQNNLSDVEVELEAGAAVSKATTDGQGRAQFDGLVIGVEARAHAVVDGERLSSQAFRIPATGGVRLVLAFGVGASGGSGAAAPAANATPAERGSVVLGEESRFVLEIVEGALEVYCLLEFQNVAGVPVDPGVPVSFSVPSDAVGTALLEGTSPQATLTGQRIDVAPPFAPGTTMVQVGYRLPITGARMAWQQTVPAAMPQTTVVLRKLPGVDFVSSQIASRRDVPIEERVYVIGSGPALGANDQLALEITGLPAHPAWPRIVTLTIAAGVLVVGLLFARAPQAEDVAVQRVKLSRQREHLLQDLVKLHERADDGRIAPAAFDARREVIVAKLERIYGALDDLDAPAPSLPRAPRMGAAVPALDARDEH